MALARVTTWSVGQVLTSSALNGEFDNILNNPSSLINTMTAAAGDLFYASAANSWGRLAVGSNGQFLTVSTGLPAYVTLAASHLSNGTTGSGAIVLASSPTMVTPTLGAASATSLKITGNSFANQASVMYLNQTTSALGDLLVYGPDTSNNGIHRIVTFRSDGSNQQTAVTIQSGVQIGSPAAGGDKGIGTINLQNDIYKSNTAYTNPDYVLERWATGQIIHFAGREGADRYDGLRPLKAVEQLVRATWALPRVHEARLATDGSLGLFGGGDALLATLEEGYLYLFDHERRLAKLEDRLRELFP